MKYLYSSSIRALHIHDEDFNQYIQFDTLTDCLKYSLKYLVFYKRQEFFLNDRIYYQLDQEENTLIAIDRDIIKKYLLLI